MVAQIVSISKAHSVSANNYLRNELQDLQKKVRSTKITVSKQPNKSFLLEGLCSRGAEHILKLSTFIKIDPVWSEEKGSIGYLVTLPHSLECNYFINYISKMAEKHRVSIEFVN